MTMQSIAMQPGEIITFYSYKGGTGRSMALANIACLLAEQQSQGKGVLMIDWDLDAPGLHKYFHDKFTWLSAGEFAEKPGLIDLFLKLNEGISKISSDTYIKTEKEISFLLEGFNFEEFIVETDIPSLSLLKAGCFDKDYSHRISNFDWENLYNRSPSLIRLLAERLSERYRYVLIDSRTGYTDIGGICTMLMPQKLVAVFTPNYQSLEGINDIVKKSTEYRRQSHDLRPLLVYPLPSRIEFSRDDLRAAWCFGNPNSGIKGYQPIFEDLFKDVYGLRECDLKYYFENVQVQQSPNYAYGEEIAVLSEKSDDRFSLTKSYMTFTDWLINSVPPWKQLRTKKIRETGRVSATKKIFVSSTYGDLMECREQVSYQLRQMGHVDIAMEYFTVDDKRPLNKCLEDVASCDLYIGIFAWKYGHIPVGKKISLTELEYRKAEETGKKCMFFLQDEKAQWSPIHIDENRKKIKTLRNELSNKYIVSFFKNCIELGTKVESAVYNWEKQNAIESSIQFDLKSYIKAIEMKYSILDLDTLTPSQKDDFIRIQLNNIFVEQNVRENPPPLELPKDIYKQIEGEWRINKECLLPEGLDSEDIKKATESYYSKAPTPVLDVITNERNKYLVILGDPGSGKSALARYIVLSVLDLIPDEKLGERFAGYLPLLIELREFVGLYSENRCENFFDYFQYLRDTQSYHLKGDEIDRHLRDNGKAIVIFDGLDEIFDHVMWERVNRMITGFALDYPKARIIVTSRIIGYKRKILSDSGFSHFTIQDFDTEHITGFLNKWYSIALDNEENVGERIKRIVLSLKESASIRQLAGNPLLLTILAIIAKHQEIPRERWKLFDHAAGVLVEHWDINRHLEDSRIDADFIDEEDKKELLRRIAFKMQSGPDGLAGNFIHRQVLQEEIEGYLKERFLQAPDRANVIARLIIDQFRTRNFILCLYGADFFGFINRAFLEYFCASAIIEKFNDQEIDIEDLKKDFYGKYWENKTWHEVLRLICGMKEKLAGDLIEHLMLVYDPQWFGNRPPWNIVLATRCLSEIRNPDAIGETAKELLIRITKLFDMVRWTQDINKFLGEEIVPAVKLVGTNWPQRNSIVDWVTRTYAYSHSHVLTESVEFDLELTNSLAEFVTDVGSSYGELHQIFMEKLVNDNGSRLLAVMALAKGWHDDPETLPWLKERAVKDENYYVRTAAVQALAQGWHDDPETLPIIKERAVKDENNYVRRAAVQALAQGWHDTDDVVKILKDRAENDGNESVRRAAVQAMRRYDLK